MSDSRKVRRCKAIRDRIYDRNEIGITIFKREILNFVSPESTLIDIGCGQKAEFLHSLSPYVKKAYGIDPVISENIVNGNMQIINGYAEAIPLTDKTVDIITMINVSEHLRDPELVFLECRRILKPGGSLFLIAPCKFYPLIFLGRAIPHCIRKRINQIITSTEREETFPSYYRANSSRALHRLSTSVGLSVVSIKYLSNHPEYFMFSIFIYRCAVAIERFVLKQEAFSCFRHQIFGHLMKPLE
jgi:ubiquinone/menaquinone biosynthesis C-methylase UbiE